MTQVQRLAALAVLILMLMAAAAGAEWQAQDWRMGKRMAQQLSEQGAEHQRTLDAITSEAWRQQSAKQDKRLATEQKLAGQDIQHTRELSDVQRNQAALRDRLATADVRLSVLLGAANTGSAATCLPPPAPSAWFMQPAEPNLTQRLLKELSPSPTTGITP